MQVPHSTHREGSRTETPRFIVIASSLQYSTHVPHPVHIPGTLMGRFCPTMPISFKSGLVQAFGQADMEIRIFTGISLPKSLASMERASDIESMLAKMHRSFPGHAITFTTSSRSEPRGVLLSARSPAIASRSAWFICGISMVCLVVRWTDSAPYRSATVAIPFSWSQETTPAGIRVRIVQYSLSSSVMTPPFM